MKINQKKVGFNRLTLVVFYEIHGTKEQVQFFKYSKINKVKGIYVLFKAPTSEIDGDQTALGLPPVTSTVFVKAK
jgi:hypothetical protein